MRHLYWIASSLLVVALALAACAPSPTPAPTADPLAVVSSPTALPPTPVPPTVAPATALPATETPLSTTAVSPTSPTQAAAPTLPPATLPPEPTAAPEPPVAENAIAWVADGQIGSGEYAQTQAFGQVTLHWSNDAEFLYMAMEARTTGWIAVGLAPIRRMQGADFIFGYVKDGVTSIWDAYGQEETGATHPPDDKSGGKNNIVVVGGSEANGVTLIEFQIPLDSGDTYDRPLAPAGQVPLIVAIGRDDDFGSYHTFRGGGTITLE